MCNFYVLCISQESENDTVVLSVHYEHMCTYYRDISIQQFRCYPVIKLYKLKIRPFSRTVDLTKVVINCVFHRSHFIVVNPFQNGKLPLILGKMYCK